MRPDLLVEATIVGFMPDGDEVTAVVCMTAEDEQDSISWVTHMPHKDYIRLIKMRELVNQPNDISSVDFCKSINSSMAENEIEKNKKRFAIAKSGVAIAKIWKKKRIFSLKEVDLTVKYLKEVAIYLPDIWKKEALEIAEELDNKFFTLRRLRKNVELFCSFSAEVISTA